MATDLQKILKEVEALPSEEQQRLRKLLDEKIHSAEVSAVGSEDEFEQAILREGLISSVPPPIDDVSPYHGRKPVAVKGKPLSETVVEERR